jgi:hypothetical protein
MIDCRCLVGSFDNRSRVAASHAAAQQQHQNTRDQRCLLGNLDAKVNGWERITYIVPAAHCLGQAQVVPDR